MLHVTGFQTERVAVLGSNLSKNASMPRGASLSSASGVQAPYRLNTSWSATLSPPRCAEGSFEQKVAESCTWSSGAAGVQLQGS